jgi:hypothetical protein
LPDSWWREHLGDPTGPVLRPSPVSPQAANVRLRVLGHANPGVGVNADVYTHGGYAYLASSIGRDCLSKGIRVYWPRDPSNPAIPMSADGSPHAAVDSAEATRHADAQQQPSSTRSQCVLRLAGNRCSGH